MKILFFLERFPTITETFILNQITSLIDLGYNIDIIARYKSRDKIIHSEVMKYNLIQKTHYTSNYINLFQNILKVIGLKSKKFIKKPLDVIKLIKLLIDEKNVHPLERIILPLDKLNLLTLTILNKYEIIHAHFGKLGKLSLFLKKIGLPIKIITTFYGIDLSTVIKKYGKDYYKSLFNYGDIFLPICNYFKKKLINLGCDPDKIVIHPLGVNTNIFRNNKKIYYFKNDQVNFLSVGRLIEKKGFIYSIEAFSLLEMEGYNFKYEIIGNGHLRSKLQSKINTLKLKESVKLTGFLNHLEVKKKMADSHIFILTSITAEDGEQEGTPTVLLEAQSMGLPVISTFHSGIPEIVKNERTGYLVKERDITSIKEKIQYLIDHPEKYIEMSLFCKQFVKENFNIRILVRKLVKIYESCLYK